MRSDIVPGDVFPDYELPDHTGTQRKLSELQGEDPLILGLKPLPWWQTVAVFVYAIIACLAVNNTVKVAMIKWRVPDAVTRRTVDVTPQIAKRANGM